MNTCAVLCMVNRSWDNEARFVIHMVVHDWRCDCLISDVGACQAPYICVTCYVMCFDIETAKWTVTEMLQPFEAEHSNSLPYHCRCSASVPLLLVGM